MRTMLSSQRPLVITGQDVPLHTPDGGRVVEGDCDCACADVDILPPAPGILYRPGSLYQKNSALYTQPIMDEWQLVANPFTSGGIALLNKSALDILDCFGSPSSLADAAAKSPDYGLHEISQLAEKLVRLKFLWSTITPEVPDLHCPSTLVVWLTVSRKCNLRCSYCYIRKNSDEISLAVGKQGLDMIFRTAGKHRFRKIKLKYAGGEPTLVFGRVLELHRYAQSLLHYTSVDLDEILLSNGICITDRMIEALQENNIRVMISLDGIGEYNDSQRFFADGRGSFALVASTIDRLQSKGLRPHLSITITARNIDGLAQVVAFALERDLSFSFNFYRENDCSASLQDLRYDDEQMIQGLKKALAVIESHLPRDSVLETIGDRARFAVPHEHACGVGKSYLVIDPQGKIAQCHMEINRPVTNISVEDPLAMVRSDVIGVQNLRVSDKEDCRECTWRYWCAGGCALATFRTTGRYDAKSPNCKIYKALYPEALRLEGLRLLKYSNLAVSGNQLVGTLLQDT